MGAYTPRKRGATKRDADIGRRVRAQRLLRGMSQFELGKRIGVTFQQIQKYENGLNQISAGRLVRIAAALDVPASNFFESDGKLLSRTTSPVDDMKIEGAEQLLRAFKRIIGHNFRQTLLRIAEHLARKSR